MKNLEGDRVTELSSYTESTKRLRHRAYEFNRCCAIPGCENDATMFDSANFGFCITHQPSEEVAA